jgi:hypothetical protein
MPEQVWKECRNCGRSDLSTLEKNCPACGSSDLREKASAYARSKGAFRKKTNSKSIRRKSGPK